MKKILFGAAALTLVALGACKKDGKQEDRALQAGALAVCPTSVLPGVISGSKTLHNDTVYILDGKTFVGNGGVLTIEPGTRIEGIWKSDPNESSALVVTKGGQIFANGDSCNPIVFTARIDGSNPSRTPGDWGGVVILGRSIVNKVNPVIEGIDLPTLPPGIDVTYGGTDSLDNSGVFKFVRIEYAGAVVAPNKELNGLTLGGVGSGTTLHHVEVAWGADDAFEFFGGTVNASYLVGLAMNDDGLDFDYGYRGAIQFALIVRSSCCFTQTYADANGIECDNDEFDNSGDLPKTRPILSNITIVGGPTSALSGTLNGVRFRRSADYIMRNSIVMGYGDGSTSYAARFDAPSVKTEFKYNQVYRFGTQTPSNVAPLDASNNILSGTSGLVSAFNCGSNGTSLNFAPFSAVAANFTTGWPTNIIPTADNYLNKSVNYRGAFAALNRNWLGCWTNCVGFLPPAMFCE